MISSIKKAVFAAVLCFSFKASAFVVYRNTKGEVLKWDSNVIHYHFVGRVPRKLILAVERAAREWSAASGGAISLIRDDSDCAQGIEIFYDRRGKETAGETFLAKTNSKTLGGKIYSARVVVNASHWRFHRGAPFGSAVKVIGRSLGWADLDAVMLHEIGHCLGLGHADLDTKSIVGEWEKPGNLPTMWSWLHSGMETLHEDDITGIRFLYPGGS